MRRLGTPGLPVAIVNSGDVAFGDACSLTNHSPAPPTFEQLACRFDLCVRELSKRAHLSPNGWRRVSAPAFRSHIRQIEGLAPRLDMVGIATWRIIASVTCAHVTKGAIFHFVRNAVGIVAPALKGYLTIANVIFSPLPRPAFIRFPAGGFVQKRARQRAKCLSFVCLKARPAMRAYGKRLLLCHT